MNEYLGFFFQISTNYITCVGGSKLSFAKDLHLSPALSCYIRLGCSLISII